MTQNQSLKTRRLGKYSDPKFVLTFNGKPISSSTTVEEGDNGLVVNIDIEALAKALGTKTGVAGIDYGALATEIEERGLLTHERLKTVLESYSNGAGGLNCSGSEVALDAKATGDIADKITDMLVKDLADAPYIKGLAKTSDLNGIKTEISAVKTTTEKAVNGLNKTVTEIGKSIGDINTKLQNQSETDLEKVKAAVKSELSDESNTFTAIQAAAARGISAYFGDSNGIGNNLAKNIAENILKNSKNKGGKGNDDTPQKVAETENMGRKRLSMFFANLVLSLMAMMFSFVAITSNPLKIVSVWCFVFITVSLIVTLIMGATLDHTTANGGITRPSDPSVASFVGTTVNLLAVIFAFVFAVASLAVA